MRLTSNTRRTDSNRDVSYPTCLYVVSEMRSRAYGDHRNEERATGGGGREPDLCDVGEKELLRAPLHDDGERLPTEVEICERPQSEQHARDALVVRCVGSFGLTEAASVRITGVAHLAGEHNLYGLQQADLHIHEYKENSAAYYYSSMNSFYLVIRIREKCTHER